MAVALNIAGLSTALAALYIIMVQVGHNLSFNRAVPDSDRVYLTTWKLFGSGDDYNPFISRPLAETAIAGTSGIETSGCIGFLMLSGEVMPKDENGVPMPVTIGCYSAGGRETLGFNLVAGNWADMVDDQCYALSESSARRLGLGVGDIFKLRGEEFGLAVQTAEGKVVAVYADPPRHSDLEAADMFYDVRDDGIEDWNEWSSVYFVKLHSGVTPEEAEQWMNAAVHSAIDESEWQLEGCGEDESMVRLVGLRDTYFTDFAYIALAHGSRTTTWTLLGIALLIVVIAFINYVNFFFAQVPIRLREVNTRKIFGCSRNRLVGAFVAESVLMVAIALGLAALLVAVFGASPLARLIDVPADFSRNIGLAALTAVVGMLVAVVASLYPALYITSFNPAFALKGTFSTATRGRYFRTGLIGFQFAVSTVLIVCAVFVHRQHAFMLDKDMGFDDENILTVKTSWRVGANCESIDNVLKGDPDVVDVAWASGEFYAKSRMTWGREIDGVQRSWKCYPVSWNFLRFMGIEVVEGRDFLSSDAQSEGGALIFNETARDQFGCLKVGMPIIAGTKYAELAGICRDFNFVSADHAIEPFSFYVMGKKPMRPLTQLFVRTAHGTDIAALSDRLCKKLCEFDPNLAPEDLDVRFLDAALQAQYEQERNMSLLVTLFTVLAVVISLMGVFGLVMFETEHRRKEIGIRRVNGASVAEILGMFCGRFVRIVLACFVVALPFSVFVVDRYLSGYPYRVDMAAWVFVAAMLVVLAMTVAVVTVRSWRAATANPLRALKSE